MLTFPITQLRQIRQGNGRSRPARTILAVVISACLLLAGCSTPATGAGGVDPQGHYPVTVTNCGEDVTFTEAPDRLLLLKSASVPALHGLGVLDRAVARAGAYPAEYYDQPTLAELAEIPQLTGNLDPSGHLHLSREVVIAQEPDLVLGQVENINRQSLTPMGIHTVEEPALCPGNLQELTFDDVYEQLRVYGEIFDRGGTAEQMIDDLQGRIESVRRTVAESEQPPRTAAVLYPTVGGGTTYSYGVHSMAHPQLEAAGFHNVFGDVDSRVFEVTVEELLGRDPDVIILLHSEGDPAPVEQALTLLPGAENLSAVRDGDVMVQLMNFTEPATPLTVTGLERIVERFH